MFGKIGFVIGIIAVTVFLLGYLQKKRITILAFNITSRVLYILSYVFLGDANFMQSSGSKPMNIEWRLNEPMPAYLWKESRKLAVG